MPNCNRTVFDPLLRRLVDKMPNNGQVVEISSPPSDEKPADIVTSSVEDEAIPVA